MIFILDEDAAQRAVIVPLSGTNEPLATFKNYGSSGIF